ncbi:MAG: thrombospondin type 3 repeat-containing protein [Chloroflexota bacterium]|nr:thrombospondin type 3 repeat-containing protein [Chloroflexota bacterium]
MRTNGQCARARSDQRSWTVHVVWLLLALLLALVPIAGVAAYFQDATGGSPATGDAQVIAHGIVTIPDADLVWRIEREVAPPPATATEMATVTGFLLGSEGALLIEDVPAGEQVRLAAGEAVLTREGGDQARAAIGASAATYFVISLAPAGSAASASGELVFASNPFAGLNGRHDIDLVRDSMAAGETTELPAGAGPTLLFVTAGAADFTTAAGEIVTLATDQAIALAGPLVVTAGPEGAVIQAAVIGPAVPRLTGPEAAANAPPTAVAAASPVAVATTAANGTPVAGEELAESVVSAPTAVPAEAEPEVDTEAVDTDGDGLSDAEEAELNTDPAVVDTDGDGLADGDEVLVHGTEPLAPDTDGDGFLDGDEVDQGTDPLSAASFPGAPVDSDGDGLPDSIEAELGTDPLDPDTDDDGLTDGDEYYIHQTGTRNPDTDGDGVLDGAEIENGTDPNDPNDF